MTGPAERFTPFGGVVPVMMPHPASVIEWADGSRVPVPRWAGMSQPFSRSDPVAMGRARAEALREVLRAWAASPESAQWLPGELRVRVVEDSDLFIRNLVVVVVDVIGTPLPPERGGPGPQKRGGP